MLHHKTVHFRNKQGSTSG